MPQHENLCIAVQAAERIRPRTQLWTFQTGGKPYRVGRLVKGIKFDPILERFSPRLPET